MTKTKTKKPLSQKAYVKSKGIICPHCKGNSVSVDHPEVDGQIVFVGVECPECSSTWEDVYELTGYDNLETPIEDED